MSITWGLNAHREATVFCSYCRAVFAQAIAPEQAREVRDAAAQNHHCTPEKPWRPGQH